MREEGETCINEEILVVPPVDGLIRCDVATDLEQLNNQQIHTITSRELKEENRIRLNQRNQHKIDSCKDIQRETVIVEIGLTTEITYGCQ